MDIAELGWALIIGEFLKIAAQLMVAFAMLSIALDLNKVLGRLDGEAKSKR